MALANVYKLAAALDLPASAIHVRTEEIGSPRKTPIPHDPHRDVSLLHRRRGRIAPQARHAGHPPACVRYGTWQAGQTSGRDAADAGADATPQRDSGARPPVQGASGGGFTWTVTERCAL